MKKTIKCNKCNTIMILASPNRDYNDGYYYVCPKCGITYKPSDYTKERN